MELNWRILKTNKKISGLEIVECAKCNIHKVINQFY
jgi:hypothetical protein